MKELSFAKEILLINSPFLPYSCLYISFLRKYIPFSCQCNSCTSSMFSLLFTLTISTFYLFFRAIKFQNGHWLRLDSVVLEGATAIFEKFQ